jgi:uncharacterized protein (DUF2384 family)
VNEKEIDKNVLEAAIKLFGGDYVEAIVWLNKPCLALGNINPINAPASDALLVINRLIHGVAQ